MTEKRYSKMMNHYGTSRTYCTGIYDNQNNRELENSNQVITELNVLYEENEQLKKLFFEMLVQTSVEIDPKKPTRYSATLIFNADEYLTVEKIMKDFKR